MEYLIMKIAFTELIRSLNANCEVDIHVITETKSPWNFTKNISHHEYKKCFIIKSSVRTDNWDQWLLECV